MKLQTVKQITAALSLSLALTACGGGGSTNGTPAPAPAASVSGVASKGPINDGTVKVYALTAAGAKGDLLGSGKTNAEGLYNVDISKFAGNVLVEVTGGTYADEATGVDTPNPGLSAAVTGVTGNVSLSVTPFTDIAVKSAGSALTKDSIDKANSLVSSMIGVNITNIKPINASKPGASANATQDQIEYGLMLATISRMVKDGNAANVEEAITKIKNDLADGRLDTTGAMVRTSLANFMADPANKTGVPSPGGTMVDQSIQYIKDNAIIPQPGNSDLGKAKAMVADFRNTLLSIYNYRGVGAAGIVETPFRRLAQDVETNVKPELTAALGRIGAVLQALESADVLVKTAAKTTQAAVGQTYTVNGLTVTVTPVDLQTYSFTVKDAAGTQVGSGTVSVIGLTAPTSGTLAATFATPNGSLAINAAFAAAFSPQGVLTGVTLTGSATAPKFSLDFSQSGRKLAAAFAQTPSSTDPDDIYPTNIIASGLIATSTARIAGSIDISGIVYNASASSPLPSAGTITGSFEEMAEGKPTGVKFTGTITGALTNAATFDPNVAASSTNYPHWTASFTGKIAAPSRPTLESFLKVTQTAYDILALEVKYQRTNTDGSVTFISGTGTLNDTTDVMTATLTNQDGLTITLAFDDTKEPGFSGAIKAAGGTKLADLVVVREVPSVKYVDNYFETLI